VLKEPPVRLCCGQRHVGPVCPDGKFMCCLCFHRYDVEDAAIQDGDKVDVCQSCSDLEWVALVFRLMAGGRKGRG
jgi:hypothetical protein